MFSIFDRKKSCKVEKQLQKNIRNHETFPTIITYLYFYFFCSLADRHTDKISIKYVLIHQINIHKKSPSSIVNSTREIDVSIWIYIYALCSLTDRLTDKLSIE